VLTKWLHSLKEAQVLIEQWRRHYNEVRPHSSLGYRPQRWTGFQGLDSKLGAEENIWIKKLKIYNEKRNS